MNDNYITEEDFFERRRCDHDLIVLDKKWSEGSSPIMLIKCGYEHDDPKPEYKKCFWYNYPSVVRCHKCEYLKTCNHYVAPSSMSTPNSLRIIKEIDERDGFCEH